MEELEKFVEQFKQWCDDNHIELDLEAASKALPDVLPLSQEFNEKEMRELAHRFAEEEFLIQDSPTVILK